MNEVQQAVADALYQINLKPDRTIRLSHSRIKRFLSCPAGYVYDYLIMPKFDTEIAHKLSIKGRVFHELAESDFDSDIHDELTEGFKDAMLAELIEHSEYAKARPYFAFPTIKEEELIHDVAPGISYIGYIDLQADEGTVLDIVDWKSGNQVNPDSDRNQGIGYAYLVNRVKGTDLAKMRCIFEYVARREPYEYRFTNDEISVFENRLLSVGERIRALEDEFVKHRTIRKVEHIRGNCTFCTMRGICRAYMVLVNPQGDFTNPEIMTTEQIAREFYVRDEAMSVNESRRDALKAALMARHQAGDAEVTKFVGITEGKKDVLYGTDRVLDRLLDRWIRHAKNAGFAQMIDWQVVKMKMLPELLEMFPRTLKRGAIPEKYLKDVDDLKFVSQSRPFIRKRR